MNNTRITLIPKHYFGEIRNPQNCSLFSFIALNASNANCALCRGASKQSCVLSANCCVEWIQCPWHPTTSSSSAYCWPPIMSLRATTSKILHLIIVYCSPTDGHWYSHYSVTGIRINPILGKEYMYIDVKIETITQHTKYSNTPSVLYDHSNYAPPPNPWIS